MSPRVVKLIPTRACLISFYGAQTTLKAQKNSVCNLKKKVPHNKRPYSIFKSHVYFAETPTRVCLTTFSGGNLRALKNILFWHKLAAYCDVNTEHRLIDETDTRYYKGFRVALLDERKFLTVNS